MAVKTRDANFKSARPAKSVRADTNRETGKRTTDRGTAYPVK